MCVYVCANDLAGHDSVEVCVYCLCVYVCVNDLAGHDSVEVFVFVCVCMYVLTM